MVRPALLVSIAALLMSCNTTAPPLSAPADFDKLTEDFTHGTLALSPVTATQAGYHEHNGAVLDEALDDYSAAGIEAQRRFYDGISRRIEALNAPSLDKEQQADVQIIKSNLALALLELDTIQNYKHNPTVYVELAGNALYNPFVLNYTSTERRFGHIIKRLDKIPALFEQAKGNLIDAPEVWNRVAREVNDGNIDLVDHTLREAAPESLKAAYSAAAGKALAALRDFNAFLKETLSKKTGDWRLGKDKYASKFEYVLSSGKQPEQLLAEAEHDLRATRDEMARLAAPKTVKQALDEIARHHPTPQTYMAAARKALEQAT